MFIDTITRMFVVCGMWGGGGGRWVGVKILVPLICEDGGLSYCVM